MRLIFRVGGSNDEVNYISASPDKIFNVGGNLVKAADIREGDQIYPGAFVSSIEAKGEPMNVGLELDDGKVYKPSMLVQYLILGLAVLIILLQLIYVRFRDL